MYTPDSLSIFTRKVHTLRFPISGSTSYKILALTENCDLTDIYDDLHILKSDVRVYSNPKFKVGGKIVLSNKVKNSTMKKRGMITYPYVKHVDKMGKNAIIDMTDFGSMLRSRLKNNFNSPRSSMLFSNAMMTFAKDKTFHNTLLYIIDLRKPFDVALNRRLAWIPLFHNLRHKENIPFIDSMIVCIISESGKPTYLKIFDKHEKINYSRASAILKSIKVTNSNLETFGETIANEVVINEIALDKVSDDLKKQEGLVVTAERSKSVIKESISKLVTDQPSLSNTIVDKLNNKPQSLEEEIKKNALLLAAVKYKMNTDVDKFNNDIKTLNTYIHTKPGSKKLKELNQKIKMELGKYIERSSTDFKVVNLSTDVVDSQINIQKVLDKKLPASIVENKQYSFNHQLFNDLVKMLKTFKNKEFPLELVKYEIKSKYDETDIKVNKFLVFKFTMKDKDGETFTNEIFLPFIERDGSMTINGLKKTMVAQLMLKPVFFPEKHICKISTFFSTIQLQYRQIRDIGYGIVYVTGMVVPMYLLYSMLYKDGLDGVFKKLGFTRKDLIITKEAIDTRREKKKNPKWFIQFDNNEYLFFPSNVMEKNQLASTFYYSMKMINYTNRHVTVDQFLDNSQQEDILIIATGKKNAGYNLRSFFNGFLDPISLEIIETQKYPTKLPDLLWKCTELIHTDKFDRRTDLNVQRYRTTETFLHVVYKQLLMSYNVYKNKKMMGFDTSVFDIKSDYVFKQVANTQLIRGNENVNPIEELSAATRMTYVGVGGVANKDGVAEKMRIVDSTYYGTIDTIDTPEGGSNIGMLQHATVDALLKDARGNIVTKEINDSLTNGISSVSAVMTPFNNHNDGARNMMAANQVRQATPLTKKEIPLVQSGYETALTTFMSESFVKKAEFDGVIKSVTDDSIILESLETKTKGKKQVVDLTPIKLTSGMSLHTLSYFEPKVKVGQKIKRHHLLAEGSSIKDGTISLGTNLLVAYMPYHGANHDDSIVLNKNVSEYLTSRHVENYQLHLLPNSKVLVAPGVINESMKIDVVQKLMNNNDGIDYEKGKVLLSYIPNNIAEFVELNPDERIYAGGVIKLKSSHAGRIVDIKIYANDDINKYPNLKQLHLISREKHNIKADGNFKIKGEKFEGVLIDISFEYYEHGTNAGDKYANRHGNKGVVCLAEENMPVTPWGQSIDMIYNPLGVIGRMNPGQLFEGYLGLIGWKMRELFLKKPNRKNVMALIKKVYHDILDKSKDKIISKTVLKTLKVMSKSQFETYMEKIKLQKGYPWIYPTYNSPSINDVKKALDAIGLKDKYILKLPRYGDGVETKFEVPIGYLYIYKMEHVADKKISSRSVGKYQSKNMQPTAGKKAKGGQRVGEFDSWSLFSHGATELIKEMFGPLSDDFISKNEMIGNVIEEGYTHNMEKLKSTPTRDLLEIYFRLMLIDFEGGQ